MIPGDKESWYPEWSTVGPQQPTRHRGRGQKATCRPRRRPGCGPSTATGQRSSGGGRRTYEGWRPSAKCENALEVLGNHFTPPVETVNRDPNDRDLESAADSPGAPSEHPKDFIAEALLHGQVKRCILPRIGSCRVGVRGGSSRVSVYADGLRADDRLSRRLAHDSVNLGGCAEHRSPRREMI
jgi:hypothetical protein